MVSQVYLPEHWGGGEKIFPDWHTVLGSTGENPASHVTVHESPTNCPLSQVIIPLVTSIVSQDSARKKWVQKRLTQILKEGKKRQSQDAVKEDNKKEEMKKEEKLEN